MTFDRLSSKVLKNIDEGYAYFKKWKDSIPKGISGAHERSLSFVSTWK